MRSDDRLAQRIGRRVILAATLTVAALLTLFSAAAVLMEGDE